MLTGYLKSLFVMVAVLSLCACDGRITVSGEIVDAKTGQPVQGAEIWFADIVLNDELRKYLDGETEFTDYPIESKADGSFRDAETIAGPGSHEVWLVVRRDGYREVRKRVWKGTGFPDENPVIEVKLQPKSQRPEP